MLLIIIKIYLEFRKVYKILEKDNIVLDAEKSRSYVKGISVFWLSMIPSFIIDWYGMIAAVMAGSLLQYLKEFDENNELSVENIYVLKCNTAAFVLEDCFVKEIKEKLLQFIDNSASKNNEKFIIPILFQPCGDLSCRKCITHNENCVGKEKNNFDVISKSRPTDMINLNHITVIEIDNNDKKVRYFDPNNTNAPPGFFENYTLSQNNCNFKQSSNTCTYVSFWYILRRLMGESFEDICTELNNLKNKNAIDTVLPKIIIHIAMNNMSKEKVETYLKQYENILKNLR